MSTENYESACGFARKRMWNQAAIVVLRNTSNSIHPNKETSEKLIQSLKCKNSIFCNNY